MPVRRHRIGDHMPQVVHPHTESVVLFGSRATGGWDEQSDLDMIIIHPAAGDEAGKREVYRIVDEAKERHYPGYRDYQSPHYEVRSGRMTVTPEKYRSSRRTLNDVMARAAREGRIFTRDPKDEDRYRHDGDVSNEWDLVTRKRLRRTYDENRVLTAMLQIWRPHPINSVNVNTMPGRNAHRLLWNSGAALLSILGVIYPRDSVAEMAEAIGGYDTGWDHKFRINLQRIDQYSGCGCEVVVTNPIEDVPALWSDLEADRSALWGRIRELSGYDLATDEEASGKAC